MIFSILNWVQRQEHRPSEVSRTGAGHQAGLNCKSRGLQARPYQGRDVKPSKKNDLKDQMLVLAPHEGIVPSDIWLTCRKKLMNNMKIQSARKATHTWLAGKIKCGNCGYALMSIFNPSGKQYLRCTKRLDNKSCPGCGKIITSELEAVEIGRAHV